MAIRTYGLSGSGMDVDQLVKDLMKAQRTRYEKVQQQKTQAEWKKKDYNTIYSLVDDFRNNTLKDFRLQSTLSPKQVVSSNDAVVTAVANGEASNIEHSLVVKQLADGVKYTSGGNITTGSSKNTLKEQFAGLGDSVEFTINGKKISIDSTDSSTINSVVQKINNAGAGVKASYDATLDRFFLYTESTGANAQINFTGTDSEGLDFLFNKLKLGSYDSDINQVGVVSKNTVDGSTAVAAGSGELKVTVNGTEHVITLGDSDTDTIGKVIDKLNTVLGAEGTAELVDGRITVKSQGIDNIVTLDGDTGGQSFLKDTLGLTQLMQHGQNTRFTIDGVDLDQPSNTFTISGVTYTLKGVSTKAADGTYNSTNVSIKADNDKTIATIKSFIDDYNALIDVVNKEINEERYRDFTPLTDEQKAEMKDSEITAWEAKAKSGMLRRDSILSSMLSDMRLNFVNAIKGVTGEYNSASSLGINTGSYVDDNGVVTSAVSNGGKIQIDEDELRKALEADPDIAYKIFGTLGDDTASKGVASRLYDQMSEVMSQLQTEAGKPNLTDTSSNIAKSLTNYNKRLTSLNSQLEMMEARYYKQFNAMETAISRMNQQSSWLSQQLGNNS